MLICHLYVFFGKVSAQIFAHFLIGLFVYLFFVDFIGRGYVPRPQWMPEIEDHTKSDAHDVFSCSVHTYVR